MLRTIFVMLVSLFCSSTTYANGIDFRISSETAEITFLSQASTFGYGGADVGIGAFINEGDDLMLGGSMLVSGSSTGDLQALHFGVGVKGYFGSVDVSNETGGAIAIGAQARYVFPGPTPLAVLFEVFIAPSVTSLIDFEGLTELRLGLELEVSPSARAYVGYHSFELDTKFRRNHELDDTAHFGIRFTY